MTGRPVVLLSVAEAAARRGCNVETIRRAIRTKELLAKRSPTAPGRPFVIRETDFEAFLKRRSAA